MRSPCARGDADHGRQTHAPRRHSMGRRRRCLSGPVNLFPIIRRTGRCLSRRNSSTWCAMSPTSGHRPGDAWHGGQRVYQPGRRDLPGEQFYYCIQGLDKPAGAGGRARDDAGRRQGRAAGLVGGAHQFHQRRQDDRAGSRRRSGSRGSSSWGERCRPLRPGRILRRKQRETRAYLGRRGGPAASSSTRPTIRPRSAADPAQGLHVAPSSIRRASPAHGFAGSTARSMSDGSAPRATAQATTARLLPRPWLC